MDYDRLRELQEKFEENPRRYFAPLANEYRKGGQPKRAIEICRAHLSQMPGHMSGQIVYGQSLFEAGEFDEARQVFERALVLDPENLIALRSLGDMELQSGNTSEARGWYSRLLDADPKDTTVIALVQEIDAADEATPVTPQPAVPGIDVDGGDQQIPWLEPPTVEAAPSQKSAETVQASEEVATPTSSIKQTPHTEWAAPQPPAPEAPVSPAPEAAPMNSEVAPPSVSRSAANEPPPPMPSEEANAYMASKAASGTESDANASSANADVRNESSAASPGETAAESTDRLEAQTSAVPDSGPSDTSGEIAAPLGLERHYPVEQAEDDLEVLGITREQPPLQSRRVEKNPLDWTPAESSESIDSRAPADTANARSQSSSEESAGSSLSEIFAAQESVDEPVEESMPPAAAESSSQNATAEARAITSSGDWFAQSSNKNSEQPNKDANAEYADSGAQPGSENTVPRGSESAGASTFSGASAEPFVNETMAQLYLQQGYRQLALQVYYRLAETRPNDQGIKDRIREIEDADSAATGGTVKPRSEDAEVERSVSHAAPRDEPERVAARQPSVKEFFATLGRRRPRSVPSRVQAAQSDDLAPPVAAGPPAPTLDNVFAGAEVSAADSRAATRLAGAFSGNPGTARTTTPRTPPVPTPRLNPRLQTHESEEDVAKFRAWLDGLTGE